MASNTGYRDGTVTLSDIRARRDTGARAIERESFCFGCGEIGHMKRECPRRVKKVGMCTERQQEFEEFQVARTSARSAAGPSVSASRAIAELKKPIGKQCLVRQRVEARKRIREAATKSGQEIGEAGPEAKVARESAGDRDTKEGGMRLLSAGYDSDGPEEAECPTQPVDSKAEGDVESDEDEEDEESESEEREDEPEFE